MEGMTLTTTLTTTFLIPMFTLHLVFLQRGVFILKEEIREDTGEGREVSCSSF